MQQDHTLLDIFKERLSNPFMFTYFWVFCFWNWHAIAWLLMEPLKVSIKLQQFPSKYEWVWLHPIWVGGLMVVFLPWINSGVEILKRWAENSTNRWLSKKGWKEMVEAEELINVEARLYGERGRLKELNEELEAGKTALTSLSNELQDTKKEVVKAVKKAEQAEKDKLELMKERDEGAAEVATLSFKVDLLSTRLSKASEKQKKNSTHIEELKKKSLPSIAGRLKALESHISTHSQNDHVSLSFGEISALISVLYTAKKHIEALDYFYVEHDNYDGDDEEKRLSDTERATAAVTKEPANKSPIISGVSTGWRGRKN